jgi:hypothetical protein
MAGGIQGRRGVDIDGDYVVFLIGACLDLRHPLRGIVELGGRRGMQDALDYLAARPEKGLLGYDSAGFTVTQYWRSFAHLERFSADVDDPHLAAWRSYWGRGSRSARTVVWHETYRVRAGDYTPIYGHVPAFVRSGPEHLASNSPRHWRVPQRSA